MKSYTAKSLQGTTKTNPGYAQAFQLPVHSSNRQFALNPYKPGHAACMDVVCFSLISGMVPCHRTANRI